MTIVGENPAVSVVIVNWNGRHWLVECLPALAAQAFQNFEIIVVDNGSTDGTVSWLQEEWPEVRLIRLETNQGFARGNNVGIAAAQGKWIALLNNDTSPERTWLQNLMKATDLPGAGSLASLVVYWDRPHQVDAAGLIVDKAGIAWNRGHGRPADEFQAPVELFGAPASAALYRRDMLEEIGGFDEAYFAYYEDVDLAWRAQNAGWRCYYCPQAKVRHRHSATGKRMPQQKLFLQSRNKIWTIAKNYSWPTLMLRAPLILSYDMLSLGYRLVTDRNLAPLKGRIAALPSLWHRRRRQSRPLAAQLAPAVPPWRLQSRTDTDGLGR